MRVLQSFLLFVCKFVDLPNADSNTLIFETISPLPSYFVGLGDGIQLVDSFIHPSYLFSEERKLLTLQLKKKMDGKLSVHTYTNMVVYA